MICIHPIPGSWSDRWSEYCAQRNIPFVNWDIFQSGILGKLREDKIEGVLFDLPLFDSRSALAAGHMTRALETLGISAFPNQASYWHYDDKLAQFYLLQSLQLPICPTYIFYNANEALDWVARTQFPKVWKLRNGAGSSNVRLVASPGDARQLIRRAFGAGFYPVQTLVGDFKTKVSKHRQQRDWGQLVRRFPATAVRAFKHHKSVPRERGYAYFQDFLAGNGCDTRITIIGNRAFGFRRLVRPNDFRASGSGRIDYNSKAIDPRCVKLAFEAAAKIGAPCLAFDFVYAGDQKPVLLEVCYRFVEQAIFQAPGFWDRDLEFHDANIWPQDAILEDFLENLKQRCSGESVVTSRSACGSAADNSPSTLNT